MHLSVAGTVARKLYFAAQTCKCLILIACIDSLSHPLAICAVRSSLRHGGDARADYRITTAVNLDPLGDPMIPMLKLMYVHTWQSLR